VNIRPHSFDFPLFLHVFGAMLLFGAVLTAVVAAWASFRSDAPVLRRAAFWSLLAVGVPSFVLMRGGAAWIYSKEGFSGHDDPTWVSLGLAVADAGTIVLLAAIGAAFWWRRSGKAVAARLSAGVSSLYLLLLAVAWLAMSGKWG
jgi:hypothetical protein